MLSEILEAMGCQVIHATGDANLLIAQTAVSVAADNITVVVADDTDVLIFPSYHYIDECQTLYFKPEAKRGSINTRIWGIRATGTALGFILCKQLPFLHALLGCDSTSRLFGYEKSVALKPMN